MTAQRIDTARTSPVGVGHQPLTRRTHALSPTVDRTAEEIDALPDDYHRALYCRTQAEHYRHQWFAGRQQEIDHVKARADGGDARFEYMTDKQLEVTGRLRWSASTQAKRLGGLEDRYSAWALMYLAFAEFQLREKFASSMPG